MGLVLPVFTVSSLGYFSTAVFDDFWLGANHRKQRKMLNPVFSVKHLRSITTIFYSVVHRVCTYKQRCNARKPDLSPNLLQMSNGIETEVGNKVTTVDIMAWLSRAALELVGQGGLGVSMDTLGDPTPNPLADSVKMMMWVSFRLISLSFNF